MIRHRKNLAMDDATQPRKSAEMLDRFGKPADIRGLRSFLIPRLPMLEGPWEIRRFPDGYSNLTYRIQAPAATCVLRTPPPGADIRSAHDMGREYRMLTALLPHVPLIPEPLAYCEDTHVMGTSFFVMSEVQGIIHRRLSDSAPPLMPAYMRDISQAAVDTLAELHAIDVTTAKDLLTLGHPEGYVARQVNGWIERYQRSATEVVDTALESAAWLKAHIPSSAGVGVIHNDFKYDNIVFSNDGSGRVKAVLDWEMSTIGDPLMDLGTALAYWSEPSDDPALKPYNLSWLPGNLSRREVVQRYALQRGIEPPDILFYYIFGCYKVGGIVQQIYARYRKGHSRDPRFEDLIRVLRATMKKASDAIRTGRI